MTSTSYYRYGEREYWVVPEPHSYARSVLRVRDQVLVFDDGYESTGGTDVLFPTDYGKRWGAPRKDDVIELTRLPEPWPFEEGLTISEVLAVVYCFGGDPKREPAWLGHHCYAQHGWCAHGLHVFFERVPGVPFPEPPDARSSIFYVRELQCSKAEAMKRVLTCSGTQYCSCRGGERLSADIPREKEKVWTYLKPHIEREAQRRAALSVK